MNSKPRFSALTPFCSTAVVQVRNAPANHPRVYKKVCRHTILEAGMGVATLAQRFFEETSKSKRQ